MSALFEGKTGERLHTALLITTGLLGLFLLVQIISGISSWRYIGTGVAAANTITISGEGEVYAVPDLGVFTFSVVSEKTTVEAAQADATAKINAVMAYLKNAGVAEKDIKTVNYQIYPQYDYQNSVCPAASSGVVYCPPGRQTLRGYEVRQSNEVKVRDISKAGDLLSGVGSKGATEVSGLSFTIDNPTAVETEARSKAIADAKTKADVLAKSLGVRLVRIVSYNESTNGIPPIYYGKDMLERGGAAASSPEISTGENKFTSNVTVVYEIR